MLHLLFITPAYEPFIGGAQAFQAALARRLSADGHRVVVLTVAARHAVDFWQPGVYDDLPACETVDKVQIERLPLVYPWPAPYAFGVRRRLGYWLARASLPLPLQAALQARLARCMPPVKGLDAALARFVPSADIVQATDSSWDGLFTGAARAAQRAGKPFVAIPLMHLGDPQVHSRFQMAHQIEAYRSAASMIALSRREAQAYETLGIPGARVHMIGMGVEPGPRPRLEDVAAFRREHGLSGPIVLFLGAATYDKGAFTLALAIADLNKAGVAVDLICAGPSQESLGQFIAGRPPAERSLMTSHIRLLGLVDGGTKACLLAGCNVLALPSRVESFGIVFLEAWRHCRPVIGADVGGIPDLISDGENGLLVPFGDRQALVSAIRRILSEPALGPRLGEAGYRILNERYGWQRTYETMLRVYDRLCTA